MMSRMHFTLNTLGMTLRIKWLPFIMFSMLMMTGVHFHSMGKKVTHSLFLGGSPSHAATASQDPTNPLSQLEQIVPETEQTQTSVSPQSAQKKHAFAEKAGNLDLLNLTQEEFQVLQSLVSHQKSIQEEAKALAHKEKKLEILQKTLSQKLSQLQQLKKSVEILVSKQEAKSTAGLLEIVKMYETMKPQEAAQILGALDFNITVDIFTQMKGKKASAILVHLAPEQAAQLTSALAQKNQELSALAA